MIEFKSFLAADMEAFLEYRREVGYTYHRLRWFLATLDRYAQKTGAGWDQLTTHFFLELRRNIDAEPGTANRVFTILRSFFDYLLRIERLPRNPLQDIPPLAEKAYIPFVFSPSQVDALLSAIEAKIRRCKPRRFVSDLAVYTAIFIMARCGLRISEPLRLKSEDYRPVERTLYIEKTKFNKDRLIPISKDVVTCLDNFLSVRRNLPGKESAAYLIATHKGPVVRDLVYRTFHRGVADIGIHHPRRTIANITFSDPKPHSLRHSFAVNTLEKACANGRLPENVLPILAAYLGHTDYRYTMKYLKVIDAEHLGAWVDLCVFKNKKEGL